MSTLGTDALGEVPLGAITGEAAEASVTVRVVDPRYIDVQHWTRLMTATLLPHGQIPREATEENWHYWAQQARQISALGQAHIPDPRGYVSWREWAFAFNAAIWGAGLGIP